LLSPANPGTRNPGCSTLGHASMITFPAGFSVVIQRLSHITLLIKHRILNFYVFENDNPINYIDPDGEIPIVLLPIIGAGVGVLIDYFSQYAEAHKKTGVSLYKYWISGEYPVERELIVGGFSALSTTLTGGISASGLPLWGKMALSGIGSGYISYVESSVLGEEFTTEEGIAAGIAGGIAAGVTKPLQGIPKRVTSEHIKSALETATTIVGNEDLHEIYTRPFVKKIGETIKKLPRGHKIYSRFYYYRNPYEMKWRQEIGLSEPMH